MDHGRKSMNIKFLIVILTSIILLSTLLSNKANATLSEGDFYIDDSGLQWEYIGKFELVNGAVFNNANGDDIFGDYANTYTGIQAAEKIFGSLSNGDKYAISTDISGIDKINHKAWYDQYAGSAFTPISFFDEAFNIDEGGDGKYSQVGDFSALVQDRANLTKNSGQYVNHVFKSVSVPEPTSLAIFSFALFAVATRRLRPR